MAQAVAAEIGGAYEEADVGTVASVSPVSAGRLPPWQVRVRQDTPEGYQRALELFQQAVDSAPDYAGCDGRPGGCSFLARAGGAGVAAGGSRAGPAEAEAALALDSTSLVVRDLYDVIRRGLFQMRRSEARASGDDSPLGNGGPGAFGPERRTPSLSTRP